MTNIINVVNNFMYCGIGKYELPMYCLYIILHAGITHLIILLKPGLWARPSTSLFVYLDVGTGCQTHVDEGQL